ncbi:Serine/threonine-protein kinase PRR1 like [Verticillium longisporum]|uniref:Serine/threonine-protein kinase PRR1 like n=1 Tax=Verticillium longisporum TaxID=100787 RepID=A0A8I2ZHK9_VERLO|nr:Serine/threonine-protein kinase PRR1 like [Verticillium longisporum]
MYTGSSQPLPTRSTPENASDDTSIPAVKQPFFDDHTISPSPPPPEFSTQDSGNGSSTVAGHSSLRIATDVRPTAPINIESRGGKAVSSGRESLNSYHEPFSSGLKPVSRTPSTKRAIANAFGNPSTPVSCVPSPVISALGDVTPLPSPLLSGDSPGPWKLLSARPPSRELMPNPTPDSVLVSASGESIAAALANASKRKVYAGLGPDGTEGKAGASSHTGPQHGRSHAKPEQTAEAAEPHIRREVNMAESRGLAQTVAQPPTPPPTESFEAYGRNDGKKRRWMAVKLLGQGTFSRVMLATSQMGADEDDASNTAQSETSTLEHTQLPRKTLVAVKVCEHGPRGGASEERIEMSLKRELEIMQSIDHPSLVRLKAWAIEPTRAVLVLSHCPGGDLFDVATGHREVLKPSLLRRMFAELVGAVKYLHERRICHRDIKLENVLVNPSPAELADDSIDWVTYPYSVITLGDLGLSRRIADDEKLETRCGSEDYAAPEVIMGLPYDGRATDAWSLGVLLYALLESRLPFDPLPGSGADAHRMRSRTSHRIARAEWRWIEYAGDDGDHDASITKFREKGLVGAMEITEGLLMRARTRWTLDKVLANEWVNQAVQVDGGIRFREEVEPEEVR